MLVTFWEKVGFEKRCVFGSPLLSLKMVPGPPRRSIVEARGPNKLPKWSPKVTLLGDLWKVDFCCYLLGLDHFGESQNDSKIDSFFEGLLGASFLRSRGPKKRPKADFSRFWADLGPPWEPLLEPFWRFLGGLKFHAFLVDFWAGAGGRG